MICYTNKSEDTLLSCPLKYTYAHIIPPLSPSLALSHTHKHTLIPLHGPLGFVVAKSLNKLRNDWNWKMSNGDSSAVPSQYGDDEIWFFEVRYIIQAEWLPRLWLKEMGHSPSHACGVFATISQCWLKINAIFTSAIMMLFLLSPIKQDKHLYVNHTRSICWRSIIVSRCCFLSESTQTD